MLPPRRFLGVAVAVLVCLTACSSANNDGPSIALALDPAAVITAPGRTVNIGGTLTATNYTDGVHYSIVGGPPGVTIDQVSIPGTEVSHAVLAVTADSTTPIGNYAVTVHATGYHVADATARLILTVDSVIPPDISSLTATPDTITLSPGGPVVNVTVTYMLQAGYIGGIGFSASGPLDAEPSFAPDTLIATIAANARVSPGTYLETLTLTTSDGPHSVGITAIVQ